MTNEGLNSMAWKNRKLVFHNTAIKEVIADLSDYFNKDLIVKNENIYNCSLTSTFDNPELKEVLDIIGLTMDLSISYSDDIIELSGEGCN